MPAQDIDLKFQLKNRATLAGLKLRRDRHKHNNFADRDPNLRIWWLDDAAGNPVCEWMTLPEIEAELQERQAVNLPALLAHAERSAGITVAKLQAVLESREGGRKRARQPLAVGLIIQVYSPSLSRRVRAGQLSLQDGLQQVIGMILAR